MKWCAMIGWLACMLIGVALLLGTGKAVAQEATPEPVSSAWRAWLLDDAGETLRAIDAAGDVRLEVDLPGLPGALRSPAVQVSPDGHYAALIALTEDTLQPAVHLIDLEQAGALLWTLPVSDASAFGVPAGALLAQAFSPFDPATTQLVIGMPTTDLLGWQVVVLDAASGTPLTTLRHTDAAVTRAGIPAAYGSTGLVPLVRTFDGARVGFTLVRGGDAQRVMVGYTWDLEAGTVRADARFAYTGGDWFAPTGTAAGVRFDGRYPTLQPPVSPGAHPPNTVYIAPPDSQMQAVYNPQDAALEDVYFIASGDLLLVDDGTQTPRHSYPVVDRTGRVVVRWTPEYGPPGALARTAAGLLYTTVLTGQGDDVTTLAAVDVTPGMATVIGERVVWAGPGHWHLITVHDPAREGAAAVNWVQLPPVFAAQGIAVGRAAEIRTEFMATLNLRAQSTTSAAVLFDLPDGERVTVSGGPVRAEGMTWWQVRLAESRLQTDQVHTGWVVQAVAGVETLAPVLENPR